MGKINECVEALQRACEDELGVKMTVEITAFRSNNPNIGKEKAIAIMDALQKAIGGGGDYRIIHDFPDEGWAFTSDSVYQKRVGYNIHYVIPMQEERRQA